jgi:tryptophanyl-tRNA synthetase
LSVRPKPEEIHRNTLDIIALLLAIGIDPKSATLFLQSQVSAHTELGWMLSPFTSIGQLNRMTQFKDKSDKFGQNAGLFIYPMLQAADIALYGAETVPVGEDQVQHLELAREIIRSFNSHVNGQILVEPKPLITNAARIMALNDPTKKMSKSIPGSAVGLLATEAEIESAVKRAVTDSDPNSSELSGGVKNLFLILEGVSNQETVQKFEALRQDGKLRYSELKEQLIDDLIAFLKPIQAAYKTLRADEEQLKRVAQEGRAKAEVAAESTLLAVKSALGLIAN